ncbi:MAG: c-type cytochrome [Bryobacteraceae bacterium]
MTQARNVILAGAAAALLGAMQLPLRLGAPAPDWRIETVEGVKTSLREFQRQHRREAVLLAFREGERIPRAELEQAARRLAEREADLLVLRPESSQGSVETPAALLVDSGGVVRRLEAGRLLTGNELEAFVDEWRLGRDVFLTSCARCHGDDGSLEICGDVKPLTGIGNRMTPAQVYQRLRVGELGETDVLIRGRFYKRREVEAVVVFVRGL